MADTRFTRILTPNLMIRRFTVEDASALSDYRSDPEVARFQGWECPYPESDASTFITGLLRCHPGVPGEWYQFAAALRETDRLVGDCAMLLDATDRGVVEFGCTFDRESQGRGYATEALEALAGYAADTHGVSRMIAIVDRHNSPAIGLVRRLGFTLLRSPDRDPPSGPLNERERFYDRSV